MDLNETQKTALLAAATYLSGSNNNMASAHGAERIVNLAELIILDLEKRSSDDKSAFYLHTS